MTSRTLLATALALTLGACSRADAPPAAEPGSADTAAIVARETPSASATEGSIDLAVTGRTVAANSRGEADSVQCQLDFTASNRSDAAVKSLIAVFRISLAADDSVIDPESTLVMPFAIPPGETREAWGPIVIDDHRCEALDLAVQPPKAAMCRTKDKRPCPPYRLAGDGVASAK